VRVTDVVGRGWVHAFEEDMNEGMVFVPSSVTLRRSRRPREAFELRPNGTARVLVLLPGDRLEPRSGRWTEEGPEIVITTRSRANEVAHVYRILYESPNRVIVRRG
jgi:hypothetical protein